MQVPIMPVVLSNTDKAVPKRSLHFKGHHKINVEVLEPIMPQQYQQLSLRELTTLAQSRISNHIEFNKE